MKNVWKSILFPVEISAITSNYFINHRLFGQRITEKLIKHDQKILN